MSLLRIIIWGLIFYIIMKVVRSISSAFKVSETSSATKTTSHSSESKSSIDKKDIIEAEFEEVRTEKDTK